MVGKLVGLVVIREPKTLVAVSAEKGVKYYEFSYHEVRWLGVSEYLNKSNFTDEEMYSYLCDCADKTLMREKEDKTTN